jgi:type IV fimbrial biogenesis protein FimT
MNSDQQRAFTLIELLVTLTLLAVLLDIALPAFGSWQQRNRDEALRQLLIAHLHQARQQAVVTNRTHQLCGSSNGIVCNGDWNRNWLIIAADSNVPFLHQQITPGGTLCWRGFGTRIAFRPNGTTTSNGRFALCRGGKASWQLVLNRQGRVRLADSDEPNNCCTTGHT